MENFATDTRNYTAELLLSDIVNLVNKDAIRVLPNFGVGHGKGGAILLNCLYAAYTGDDNYYAEAEKLLEAAFKELNPSQYQSVLTSNFYLDIAEFAGLLIYLEENGHLSDKYETLLSQVDDLLAERLIQNIEEQNFGMSKGAIGIGFYLIKRSGVSLTALNAIDHLLNALDLAKEGNQITGYYWTCKYFKEPRVYTGLAHGNAMMISFFCSLYEAGYRQEKCKELVTHSVQFLLQNRMDSSIYTSVFPLWIKEAEKTTNHCLVYGDIGTAYAIIRAAVIFNHKEYLKEGIEIALLSLKRKTHEETFLNDASVKYGAASPCLIYNRIYQLTGITSFKQASAYWAEQIPVYAVHNNESLGFNSFFFGEFENAQLDLNFGLIGIGLTILQAISDQYAINKFIWLH
ncbi:lanthionine synthetase LanC family protein [Pedobacter sp. L105]|uniref:lanthionine synthetase LanC family protein n=1 Tax=Pedobacter sp. L105 TaxID=1641871 RepID=UPI00131C9A90|nr:lanthionine synthetase LanC family protein [Pedobacter sp. L105]